MSSVGVNPVSAGFKPCADCTCSRGLLYRQRQRSVLFRQLSRRHSGFYKPSSEEELGHGRSNSVTSSDNHSISESIISECETRNVNTSQRLLALRQEMAKEDICCYIVPSEDEHNSEYVSFADQRRAFISGFTGSAGVAVITRDLLNFNLDSPEGKSMLSTDGRYFMQAAQELDFNWTLNRQNVDKKLWQEWCIDECIDMWKSLGADPKKICKIGVDPKLFPNYKKLEFEKMIAKYGAQDNVKLVPIEQNLIDTIWGKFEQEPVRVLKEVYLLEDTYSGESFESKRKNLITKLDEHCSSNSSKGKIGNHFFVISALDEICWLLNLRGSDIEYNPVFFSYVIINGEKTTLFVDNVLGEGVEKYLRDNNVQVEPYKNFWSYLEFGFELDQNKNTMDHLPSGFYVPLNCSWAVVNQLSKQLASLSSVVSSKSDKKSRPSLSYAITPISSPLSELKSIKNVTEQHNANRAQVQDATAIIQYFAWLENELVKKGSLIDEQKGAHKLLKIRQTLPNFKGLSFETISSTGGNSSIIHYSPPVENSSMIDPSKMYLCDSGAQFLEGTTDITRTVHFTKPTKEEIANYTLVLKGNLALERLKFPCNSTNGYQLDVLARQFLWQYGLDYGHGTGHGVGSFLNVHEGPIGIGNTNRALLDHVLQEGQIITNEPGYYKDGEYGIRIENDLLVVKSPEVPGFLQFENLTLVPYCKKLINPKLLTSEEKNQINKYHSKIWTILCQYIQPQSITFKWLKRECSSL